MADKKQHEMMQTTTTTTNWFDLPWDIQVDILRRVFAIEKLWNIPKVCRDWRKICKEPSMWRVIYMGSAQYSDCWPDDLPVTDITARKMCKNVVDRSQGQLVDIAMVHFCDDELLEYVANRSPKLSRLEIAFPKFSVGNLSNALKKLPKLEELKIYSAGELNLYLPMGSYCPELKRLGLNACWEFDDDEFIEICENLRELKHLELHKNSGVSYIMLQAILDGCPSLEVLDLRGCHFYNGSSCQFDDLKRVFGKRLEQIKCVLHNEPLDTQPYNPYSKSAWLRYMWKKTCRKVIIDAKITASMSDSDSDSDLNTCPYYRDEW